MKLKDIFPSKNYLILIDGMWEEMMLELHVIDRNGEDLTLQGIEIQEMIEVPTKPTKGE